MLGYVRGREGVRIWRWKGDDDNNGDDDEDGLPGEGKGCVDDTQGSTSQLPPSSGPGLRPKPGPGPGLRLRLELGAGPEPEL